MPTQGRRHGTGLPHAIHRVWGPAPSPYRACSSKRIRFAHTGTTNTGPRHTGTPRLLTAIYLPLRGGSRIAAPGSTPCHPKASSVVSRLAVVRSPVFQANHPVFSAFDYTTGPPFVQKKSRQNSPGIGADFPPAVGQENARRWPRVWRTTLVCYQRRCAARSGTPKRNSSTPSTCTRRYLSIWGKCTCSSISANPSSTAASWDRTNCPVN